MVQHISVGLQERLNETGVADTRETKSRVLKMKTRVRPPKAVTGNLYRGSVFSRPFRPFPSLSFVPFVSFFPFPLFPRLEVDPQIQLRGLRELSPQARRTTFCSHQTGVLGSKYTLKIRLWSGLGRKHIFGIFRAQ